MKRKTRFMDPAVWRQIQTWSVIVFSAAIPIGKFPAEASLVIGLLAWFIRLGLERRQPKIPGGRLNLLLLVWLAAAAVSCLNSIDLIASTNGIRKFLKLFAAYLLIVDTVRTRAVLSRVLIGAFAGLAITLADCGWQAVFGTDVFYQVPFGAYLGGWRITGPFGHAADLGIHLVTMCPIVMALALRGTPKARPALWIIALATSVTMLFTMARGGILAFAGSMFVLSVLLRHWAPAVLGLAVGTMQVLMLPADVKAWAASEPTWLHRLTQPERLNFWHAAWNMIKAHPFIGVGINTFVLAYPAYRIVPDAYNQVGPYAHNQYLHMAAEMGMFGFAAFMLLLIGLGAVVRRGLAARGTTAEDKAVTAGLGAGIVAFSINGLLESSLYYGKASLLFWWLAGLIIAVDGLNPAKRRTG